MLTDGGLDEHGYLVYTPDPEGLRNQNRKDSEGAVRFADGAQATGPIAVSEPQGYAYDALLRTAALARQVWNDAPYAGHLLWSGILDGERARRVGRRLLEPDFFSGWAIRTLAAGQHHPLSYHRGSAWPHDNAVIALGLARHGPAAELARLTEGLVAAAARHGYRLPEVIAGYDRSAAPKPVPYPHSCSPQAWAAATPLALRTARRLV